MKRTLIITAGLCLCGLSAPSYAQSSEYENAILGQSTEARVGITIPFGGDHRKAQSKPQFVLGLRQETARPRQRDWALRPATEAANLREFKLSLTMESAPMLLLNDQVMDFGAEAAAAKGTVKALDTYDKTVLTVIAVSLAVIGGIAIAVSAN